jgi:hypothetical protein
METLLAEIPPRLEMRKIVMTQKFSRFDIVFDEDNKKYGIIFLLFGNPPKMSVLYEDFSIVKYKEGGKSTARIQKVWEKPQKPKN